MIFLLCLTLQMERESVPTTYTENDRSMLKYLYDCVFFVMRKPVHLCNGQHDGEEGHHGEPQWTEGRNQTTT